MSLSTLVSLANTVRYKPRGTTMAEETKGEAPPAENQQQQDEGRDEGKAPNEDLANEESKEEKEKPEQGFINEGTFSHKYCLAFL